MYAPDCAYLQRSGHTGCCRWPAKRWGRRSRRRRLTGSGLEAVCGSDRQTLPARAPTSNKNYSMCSGPVPRLGGCATRTVRLQPPLCVTHRRPERAALDVAAGRGFGTVELIVLFGRQAPGFPGPGRGRLCDARPVADGRRKPGLPDPIGHREPSSATSPPMGRRHRRCEEGKALAARPPPGGPAR